MTKGKKDHLRSVQTTNEGGKAMGNLDLQRGCEVINRKQLEKIPVPEATDSYCPIAHTDLVERVIRISKDLLRGFTLSEEQFFVTRQGQQFVGFLKFRGKNPELGLSVIFRNSYDRSMSVGLAVGANISFCDSLALQGEIAVMRKHTKNVMDALEDLTVAAVYRGRSNYEKVIADSKRFKEIAISKNKAFQLMGLLYGYDVISPRQLATLKEEWLHPSKPEFQEKNMWTFFCATMQCLKNTPPISIIDRHIEAYKMLIEAMRTNKDEEEETVGLRWFDIDPAYKFQFNH